jgi:hypothetical protein
MPAAIKAVVSLRLLVVVDPYVLRQYKSDAMGELKFNRLGIRSVKRGIDPVQFLVYRSQYTPTYQTANKDGLATTDSIEPELLALSDIGARLISLSPHTILAIVQTAIVIVS